jgi:hypothetical protein
VRQSFAQFLLSEYTTVEVTSTYPLEILRALIINDLERVRRVIHFLIQAIPYHNWRLESGRSDQNLTKL